MSARSSSPLDRLHEDFRWTPRQRQVLDLLAARRTNGEIATALGISLDGAKWHVSEVMTKLGTNSRDEAAEYWRAYNRMPLRFSRMVRGMVAGLAIRKVAVGTGVVGLIAVAALGVLLLANLGDGDSEPAAPDGTPSPSVDTSTPQATTTPTTAPPSGTPEPLEPIAVPNGGTVPSDNGLLYVDLDSGDMEFWPMPGDYYGVHSRSDDGRWVIWAAFDAGGSIDDGIHLLDTRSGTDTVLQLHSEPATAARLSDDGSFIVLWNSATAALVRTEPWTVLATHAFSLADVFGSAEFAPDGSVALGFGQGPESRSTLVLHPDGAITGIAEASWPWSWSPDSTLLAATTNSSTQVLTADGDLLWEVPFVEDELYPSPRWSPDGKYLAIALAGSNRGSRVFDTSTHAEILRTVGTPTCLDYWNPDGTLDFAWDGRRLSVPSGEVLPPDPSLAERQFEYEQTGVEGLTRLKTPSGRVIDFNSNFWSVYFDEDGVYDTTSDGRAFFLIGVGGKGICGDGDAPEPAVLFPPF